MKGVRKVEMERRNRRKVFSINGAPVGSANKINALDDLCRPFRLSRLAFYSDSRRFFVPKLVVGSLVEGLRPVPAQAGHSDEARE